MARVAAVDNGLRPISTGLKRPSARANSRQAGGDPAGREVGATDKTTLATTCFLQKGWFTPSICYCRSFRCAWLKMTTSTAHAC